MEIIKKHNSIIWEELKATQYSPTNRYVENQYLFKKKVADGLLIYNAVTKEIILLDVTEQFIPNEFFVSNFYFVNIDLNQYEWFVSIENAIRAKYRRTEYGDIPSATIFTTSNCNARCPYCYERESGYNEQHCFMTEETARHVGQWIIDQHTSNFDIGWFGGEPLLNIKAIDIISNYIRDNSNIEYTSSMTSNGYLLDEVPIGKMKDIWHLKRVQITLDGVNEKYRQVKNYIYNDSNPFEKVISNIKRLIDNNINVTVRMNVTDNNYQDMINVIDYLNKVIHNKQRLVLSPHAVFPLKEGSFKDEVYNKIYNDEIKIYNHIRELGYKQITHVIGFENIRTTHCMADSKNHVIIDPDGKIGLCEHITPNVFLGDLNTKKSQYNKDVITKWSIRTQDTEKCKFCSLRPFCYYLKNCNGEELCNDAFIKMTKWKLDHMIENVYRGHLNNKNNNQEMTDQCNVDVIPGKSVMLCCDKL